MGIVLKVFMSLASLRLLINLISTLNVSVLKRNGNHYVQGFMIVLKDKEVMILWLALFRVQERQLMLKACTFKRPRINAFPRKT